MPVVAEGYAAGAKHAQSKLGVTWAVIVVIGIWNPASGTTGAPGSAGGIVKAEGKLIL